MSTITPLINSKNTFVYIYIHIYIEYSLKMLLIYLFKFYLQHVMKVSTLFILSGVIYTVLFAHINNNVVIVFININTTICASRQNADNTSHHRHLTNYMCQGSVQSENHYKNSIRHLYLAQPLYLNGNR
jgi:hypothetical protein